MNNSSNKFFNVGVIGIAIFCAIAGLLTFALKGAKPKVGVYQGPIVVVWGTEFGKEMKELIKSNPNVNISYEQKTKDQLTKDFLTSVAQGKGPDLLLLSNEDILTFKDYIVDVPFKAYSERKFQDNFADIANLLKIHEGFMGLPLAVDPLVMYYNRDQLNQQGVITAPKSWSEIIATIPNFTKVNKDNFGISKSAIALGEFTNVTNAKDIMSMLFLQSGSKIISYSYNQGSLKNELKSELNSLNSSSNQNPSLSALNFYTQFVDPNKSIYSWNRSLPSSLDEFLGNDLAFYLGFGSERSDILTRNPNLNFDMTMVPQSDTNNKSTLGKMYSLVLLKTSTNQANAFSSMQAMTDTEFAKSFANSTNIAPIRRDLLSNPPSDLYSRVLYESSFRSKGWLDPSPSDTSVAWKEMIEAVTSGKQDTVEALRTADKEINLIIK